MSNYFDVFPKINYDMNKDGNTTESVNIMLRYKIRDIVLKYTEIMFEYVVKDGEKPYIVADKYYGRTDLSELILLTNRICDPYYEWPMSYFEFIQFIKKKYESVRYSKQTVHSYWRIIQPRTVLVDGTIIPERKLRVDQNTYLELTDEERSILYLYDYEYNLNESRRNISLIKKTYIPQIEQEMKLIFK